MELTELEIDRMIERYRRVRIDVYERGTLPASGDASLHQSNKATLRSRVQQICSEADLSCYSGTTEDRATMRAIWKHLWTKNRYAGIKAQIATTEIGDIESVFDDYAVFTNADWDIEARGHQLVSAGAAVNDFLNRQGVFQNKQTIGNLPKLKKIVKIARALNSYAIDNPRGPALSFVTDGNTTSDVWEVHEHLTNIGYTGALTALHFMMDMGFQVVKPDIVISKEFLAWGWLQKAIPELPPGMSKQDLHGTGNYGNRYNYTHARVYKPIIDLSRRVVSRLKSADLESDIGWVTSNPLREFDLFLVKYGQKPEKEMGIERTLFDETEEDEDIE